MATEDTSNTSTEIISKIIPVPTLSTQGWVRELSAKIDYLLAHYFSTDEKQSNVYAKSMSNIQSIIQNHAGDPVSTADAISRSVQTYLGRYYENVVTEATYSLDDEEESETTIKITLALQFTEQGVVHTANRLLSFYNGKFKEITEANNG